MSCIYKNLKSKPGLKKEKNQRKEREYAKNYWKLSHTKDN